MKYRAEPLHTHGAHVGTGILLVNLGTPDAPTAAAVKRYLREFLTDPRVVEIPALLWRPLLAAVILPRRAPRSAVKYAAVWQKEGSPLRYFSERQARLLKGLLGTRGQDLAVVQAMRYGEPSVAAALDELHAAGIGRILVLPLYPQYAASTTASAFDAIAAWMATCRNAPELRFIKHYHDHPGYIEALAAHFRTHTGAVKRADPTQAFAQRTVVFSFHGLPERSRDLGDPYFCECHKTARLLAEALGLSPGTWHITFQSRFGRARWLTPYTEATLVGLAKAGVKAVDVFCPGFPADCLETLEEIAMECKAAFLSAGGQDFHYVPALNDNPVWIAALADIASQHLAGWSAAPYTEEDARQTQTRARALGASR